MMDRWNGCVAVVTGASSGIGEAICVKFVEAGLKVAGLARRVEKVEQLSQQLTGKVGKLFAIKCDVTVEEDVKRAFKLVEQTLGPCNILVNNAGVAKPTNLINGDVTLWKQVIETNLLGICLCTKEAIKQIRAQVPEIPGHIFHINSILGHKVSPFIPQSNVYPATKHGVTALAETLRVELNNLKSQIKITSVSPGLVRTEIASANNFVFDDVTLKQLTLAPILEPDDVADAIVFALATKPHVLVQELIIRPVGETF